MSERAAETENTPEQIDITPNYDSMYKTFMNDFLAKAKNLRHLDTETFSTFHGILASLNIAIQAIDSVERLEEFRTAFAKVVSESSTQLTAKRQADDEAENCTCDFPSTLGGHHSYCAVFEGYDDEPEVDERHGDALSPGADYEDNIGFEPAEQTNY